MELYQAGLPYPPAGHPSTRKGPLLMSSSLGLGKIEILEFQFFLVSSAFWYGLYWPRMMLELVLMLNCTCEFPIEKRAVD